MIRLRRNRQDPDGNLIRPAPPWPQLAQEALAEALHEAEAHKAKREVYAHDLVRAALEELFHGKCAYCESRVTARSDWPVEHFRPKGRVAERPDHPGYYWLAYEWTNLYLACTLCNERRRDRARWGDCSFAGTTGGKADQFPLVDEAGRAMSPSYDLDQEKPLLLDPCRDDPADFLGYGVNGEVMAVADNPRGQATIDICHLNRSRLCDLRRDVVTVISGVLTILTTGSREISETARADFLSLLHQWMLADSREYAAVARTVFRDPAAFGLSAAKVAALMTDAPSS